MISPVKPIGPVIWALGANAPIARPTNRAAPTPRENPPDADLADQIAQSDRQERRPDRLASDDIARKVQHDV